MNQAKSVFDLIESVNRFAFPLLISLIFPIIWIIFKKLFGLSNEGDKAVFYSSLTLFIIGGIILKIGEYKEETIRQKALSLKHLYENDGYLYYYRTSLNERGYSDETLDKILYNYPNEFLESGPNIVCVDSLVKKHVTNHNYALFDAYIREKLKSEKMVNVMLLFQDDSTIRNVKNYFSQDIVYGFLAANKGKFNIDVVNDSTMILKAD
ncbi:hypothetical protein [Adhaeribacter rhizoryzae]|uniref:Uncharacterized protein n=1 Tax=Adhaeribacter rhizoryzae TaxID=2607907 RepID=A0A5M6DRF8_9BACT|nr:hypothetical protein [Adhaeribacter rhizoryzae]KAA5547985.1 hypothetical protein F0145_08600 [Adhaeribacter rhizoryzae]